MPAPFHSCRRAGRDHALSKISLTPPLTPPLALPWPCPGLGLAQGFLRPTFLLLNGHFSPELRIAESLAHPLLDGSNRLVDHAIALDNRAAHHLLFD
jgi:hypothetical protein